MNTTLSPRLNTVVTTLVLVTAAAWAVPTVAQTAFPATLAGHAILPAMTLVPAPADAPQDLQISGRYAGPAGPLVDSPEIVTGM